MMGNYWKSWIKPLFFVKRYLLINPGLHALKEVLLADDSYRGHNFMFIIYIFTNRLDSINQKQIHLMIYIIL